MYFCPLGRKKNTFGRNVVSRFREMLKNIKQNKTNLIKFKLAPKFFWEFFSFLERIYQKIKIKKISQNKYIFKNLFFNIFFE